MRVCVCVYSSIGIGFGFGIWIDVVAGMLGLSLVFVFIVLLLPSTIKNQDYLTLPRDLRGLCHLPRYTYSSITELVLC